MADRDDQNDGIFEDREEGEDETSNAIREALAKQGFGSDEDDDDGAGFDQDPIEGEDTDNRVSQEEGTELATDAQLKRDAGEDNEAGKGAKDKGKKAEGDEEETDEKGSETDAKDEADKDDDKEGKEDEEDEGKDAPDLTQAPVDQLMKDVPEASRAELTRRLSDAEKAMAPFQSEYAQQQMKMHGATPQEMSSRLVQLAEYAATKPDEYIAWAAREMAASPDKVGDVLGKAAELHGYKLVRADEAEDGDDDVFDDEETKRLKRENAEMRRKLETPREFGPDTPQLQQQRAVRDTLTNFVTERNPDGSLKRPHYNALENRIVELARAQATQTRQPVTVEDLDRFYQMAEADYRGMFGNSAAQKPDPVQQDQQRKADAADKAKRASTSIDGTGQGASRRPAPAADADIDDVLRYALNKSVDG